MFSNYYKVAVRNFKNQNVYSVLNILGLTMGITFGLILILFVKNEFSYDRFHPDAGNLYRVVSDARIQNTSILAPNVPSPLGPYLSKGNPELEYVSRMFTLDKTLIVANGKSIYSNSMYAVDGNFLKMFGFKLVSGDIESALNEPNGIVLTRSEALKFWDNEDAVGKSLVIDNKVTLNVTGILENIPATTHFDFAALVSYNSFPDRRNSGNWVNFSDFLYIKTPPDMTDEDLHQRLNEVYSEYMLPYFESVNASCKFIVQPVTSIHLNSDLRGELKTNASANQVYIFLVLAVFLLVMAGINYVNIATARSATRTKEIGVRKTLGSYNGQIRNQFLVESLMFAFFSTLLSLVLVEFLTPYFNVLLNKSISLRELFDWKLLVVILSIILSLGVLGGLYPAVFISRFKPVEVLKGKMIYKPGGVRLRMVLVVFQFAVSIIMIISTWLISDQINYIRNKDLGFESRDLVVLDASFQKGRNRIGTFLTQTRSHASIESISSTAYIPASSDESFTTFMVSVNEGVKEQLFKTFHADRQFIPTLGLELITGNNFSTRGVMQRDEVIINQSLADRMGGGEDAIGRSLSYVDGQRFIHAKVVGVVNDFHSRSFHEEIKPLVILPRYNNTRLLIRLNSEQRDQSIQDLKQAWSESFPEVPMEIQYLEDEVEKLYTVDENTARIMPVFSMVSVFIAILGLFGLASFTIEYRRKEIGVRKISGANLRDIIWIVNANYIKLVLTATLAAWPISYLVISLWMKGFAYTTSINPMVFVYSVLTALITALATVSYHTWKAVNINPVNTLGQD